MHGTVGLEQKLGVTFYYSAAYTLDLEVTIPIRFTKIHI